MTELSGGIVSLMRALTKLVSIGCSKPLLKEQDAALIQGLENILRVGEPKGVLLLTRIG